MAVSASFATASGHHAASVLAAGPPTQPQRLPSEAWSALMSVLSYAMWFGIVACVVALVACGGMFAYQRKQNQQYINDDTLARICVCAVVVGAAPAIANALI